MQIRLIVFFKFEEVFGGTDFLRLWESDSSLLIWGALISTAFIKAPHKEIKLISTAFIKATQIKRDESDSQSEVL